MKKLLALCFCFAMILSLGVLPISAAAPTLHETFESLVSFENYKCQSAQPNGFAASVIRDEMMERYAFDLSIEWWGENAPSYTEAKKADFESYVNARYEVSAPTWDAIRAETVGYYDPQADNHEQVPFFNAEKQVYIIASPGGYGGGIPQSEYVGYVKNGEFYEVYLQLVDYVETKPSTGVEGKDWFEEEMYGDTLYKVPSKNYHKYTVTYNNGIMKKYKSTNETAVPANLIKAGEAAPTTTTKKTTSTTKAAATTTTTTTVSAATTTVTDTTTTVPPVQELPVTAVETEDIVIKTAEDAFPKDTVVEVVVITEGETLTTVQTALEEIVEKFVVFEITAQSNNVAVQPNGIVRASFTVPDGYNPDLLAVYYVAPDGQKEEIPSTVDNVTGTIVAELSHFSTYVLAEKTATPIVDSGTDTTPAVQNTFQWMIPVIIAVVVLAAAGAAVWFFMMRKNNATNA